MAPDDIDSVFDFTVRRINGEPQQLADYRGQTLLVVNTASACAYTPQLAQLQDIHSRLHDRGLVVLGFPCNQFGGQDSGSNSEIASFCRLNYGVDFPMMEKVDVNGSHAAPIFQWLKHRAPGILGTEAIKWNFTKFLLDRNGHVLRRYAPQDKPESFVGDIEKALATAAVG